MIKYISIFTLLICCLHTSGQQKINCETLLKRKLNKDAPQQIFDNLKHADCFGLDSTDVELFMNAPMLGSLLTKYTPNRDPGTYGELLLEFNKIKADTAYQEIKRTITTTSALKAIKVSSSTWESGKAIFKEMKLPNDEIGKIHEFMSQNLDKDWSYLDLLLMYGLNKNREADK